MPRSTTTPPRKRGGTVSKIVQIYQYTAKEDTSLPWLMTGAFILPVVLGIILCFAISANVLTWILLIITAVMLGALLATMVLTRRADSVGFKAIEGKPGATGAVLDSINKGGFNFTQEPVWIEPRTKDAIWRGTGRTGVYLIGEGDYHRVNSAMNRQEAKIKHITPGSHIPIIRICVGNGKNQVPLNKLKSKVLRQKVTLSKAEVDQLDGRLRTLQSKNYGIPKGVDPSRMRVSRRALRGK